MTSHARKHTARAWMLLFKVLGFLLRVGSCLIVKVQGKDRSYVKFVAEQLGLDGSYVSRTYIEQIQLEKLVNDVLVLLLILLFFYPLLACVFFQLRYPIINRLYQMI